MPESGFSLQKTAENLNSKHSLPKNSFKSSNQFTPPKPHILTNLSLSQRLGSQFSSKSTFQNKIQDIQSQNAHLSIQQIDISEKSNSDNENYDQNSLGSSQLPSEYFYDAREVQFDSDLDEVLDSRLVLENFNNELNPRGTFRARNQTFQEEITTSLLVKQCVGNKAHKQKITGF